MLEGSPGPYAALLPVPTMEKLVKDLPTNETLLHVLELLGKGGNDKAAKVLEWEPPAVAVKAKEPDERVQLVVSMGEGEEFESSLKVKHFE